MSAQQGLQPTSVNISYWITRMAFEIKFTWRISANIDKRLKVGDNLLFSSFSLKVDRFEKQSKCFYKSCICARFAVWEATSPETKKKNRR